MRILILLLALPILLLLCTLTAYWMPLPAALDGSRDQIAAIAAGLLGAGYLAGLLGFSLRTLRRAGRALDPVLLPLGLAARREFPFGRRYTGAIDRRAVEVIYHPAYALQPAALDVTVRAQLGQHLAASAGPQRPLLDCRGCPRLEVSNLPGIQIYAADEARARAWLADESVQAALVRLLAAPDARGACELYVQPERLWFRVRLRRKTEGEMAAWVADVLPNLLALAHAGGH